MAFMVHEVQMGKLRKRQSFSHIDEILDMPDLIEVQKNSYRRFLEVDMWTIRWTSPKTAWNAARNAT